MLRIFSKSDIGLVRKSNEDACKSGILPDGAAWAVVCDGMGGANGGDVASGIAVDRISEQILTGYSAEIGEEEIQNLISEAVLNANDAVHDRAGADEALSGMGTTVVVAVVSRGVARIAHAGDSRAYLITRDGIRQLTTDHSMVQELVDKGDLTVQEAKKHPQKNVITRALGVDSFLQADYCKVPFPEGSRLLICTDGLTNYVDEEQIFRLAQEMDADDLTGRLVAQAKQAGGSDNITVTVVEN
ncbi:Stp1/IreP family PP2C-type Ser/Thr phosphatase [Caproicibacter sp.]|uniref:Stp1/IreP family PP2C-type Ser/Thr phosphatase n=1 Tax=Caproicibacter sp. TaxID=2814884 RepID=UPI0039896AE4